MDRDLEKPRGPVIRSDPTDPGDRLTWLRVCKMGERQPLKAMLRLVRSSVSDQTTRAFHVSSFDLIIASRCGFSQNLPST